MEFKEDNAISFLLFNTMTGKFYNKSEILENFGIEVYKREGADKDRQKIELNFI